MGYEFAAAVADLVDNSIAAKSTIVWVDLAWGAGGNSAYVSVNDNGLGMSPQELREALRFGSQSSYEEDDLGKFGLGLKTASLSQCLKLTVASRRNQSRADIAAYCWDVEHVDARNRWEILPVATHSLHEHIRQHLKATTGTAVIWERLDRILSYKKPEGEVARKQINAMCRELEEHLGMVFHRFLSGEIRGKRLAIYVNSNKVRPWDPFARAEPNTKMLGPGNLRIDGLQGKGQVTVEPFVLPAQSRFSTPEAWNRASGPGKWNKQQGFYIYRAGRLVQSGGWNGIRALDEHRKLLRVAISFSPALDEEFKINVPKMRVALPPTLRDAIANFIAPAVQMAENEYRQRQKKDDQAQAPTHTVPKSGSKEADVGSTASFESRLTGPLASVLHSSAFHPEVDRIYQGLLAADVVPVSQEDMERVGAHLLRIAHPGELPALARVLARALFMSSSNDDCGIRPSLGAVELGKTRRVGTRA